MIYIDRKYVALLASKLNQFKQKSTDLYVFRCPICGDSEKSKIKARGYVYSHKNMLMFKCHNCGDSRSFGKLLQTVDQALYNEYIMEKYKTSNSPPRVKVGSMKFTAPVFPQDTPHKILTKLNSVECITHLPEDNIAVTYLRDRQVPETKWKNLFMTTDDHELESLHLKYRGRIKTHDIRLLIPTTDKNGKLTGINGRTLTNANLRYLTMKFNAEEDPMIYGLSDWDSHKYTYVTEGAIDSMFLPNALAVGGSDFGKIDTIIDKLNTTIVFDNEPRNKEIHRSMAKVIASGHFVCIWPDKINQKDINEMMLDGLVDIQTIIDTCTFRGLEAELRLHDWSKSE